jgi:squalene-hopene/tetraprenyl-beta-curcumene cyclase
MPGIDDGEGCAIAHFLSLWQSSGFERPEDGGLGFFRMISFGRKLVRMACFLAMAVIACSCSTKKSEHVEYAQDEKPVAAHANHDEQRAVSTTWNKAAAANYLDQRETFWMKWQGAKRDQGTFCVSCHTNLTFVFAQTALRELPTEPNTSDNERKIIDDVKKRVRLWNSVEPYYGDKEDIDGNGPGSRATEAVLNAVILAFHDSQTGELSDDTRAAFHNMWALQQTAGDDQGAWLWQKFRLGPWESRDSPYFGATLAALAVGIAPGNYRSSADIQGNLASLQKYLDGKYSEQPLLNRIGLLWASTKWPGLLTPKQQKSIIEEIYEKQQSDGGWSLSSLTWSSKYLGIPSLLTTRRRNDWTPQETKSDGLATGYIAFVLEQAGVPRENAQMKSALGWLTQNQNQTEGFWTAYSLNKRRDPSSNVGRFMTDAATAFAVLALSENVSQ